MWRRKDFGRTWPIRVYNGAYPGGPKWKSWLDRAPGRSSASEFCVQANLSFKTYGLAALGCCRAGLTVKALSSPEVRLRWDSQHKGGHHAAQQNCTFFAKGPLLVGLVCCLALAAARPAEGAPIFYTVYLDRAAFNGAVQSFYGVTPTVLTETFDEPTTCSQRANIDACDATYGPVSFFIGNVRDDPQYLQQLVKLNEVMPPFIPYGGSYYTSSTIFQPAVALGFDVYPADFWGRTDPGGIEMRILPPARCRSSVKPTW